MTKTQLNFCILLFYVEENDCSVRTVNIETFLSAGMTVIVIEIVHFSNAIFMSIYHSR